MEQRLKAVDEEVPSAVQHRDRQHQLQNGEVHGVGVHGKQIRQRQNVFLDQGYMTDEYLTPDYFRWLYTAFTRATKTLYLVNYPKEQVE